MQHYSLYPYEPSKALPIIFAASVLLSTISIVYQSIRYRWWHFGLIIFWASMIWLAGFIIREIAAFKTWSVSLYIAQYILIFMGPPLYAASEFFILGRLLAYLPYYTPLHPGRVLSTFLLLSGAVEGLASSGAATVASRKAGSYSSGLLQLKISLILQEVVEVCFFGLVALVEYRCRRANHFPRNVRIMCRVLYVTSFMMTIRCIVRTIEGFETCDPFASDFKGYCGPIQHYEWYLWIFEVANIALFISLLACFHPGKYLPSNKNQYLDPTDITVERIGPGYSAVDNRHWMLTVFDPFNIGGMISGKGIGIDQFWVLDNPIAEKCFATSTSKSTSC